MTAFIKCQLLLIDMSFFSATQWKQVNRSQAKKAQPSLSFLFAAKIKTICFSDAFFLSTLLMAKIIAVKL